MNETTVFNEIITHQKQGIILYDEIADMFDYLALRGYKRLSEFYSLYEFAEMRSTSRYVINHLDCLPDTTVPMRKREIIPSSWKDTTRFRVSEGDRKSKVRELFDTIREWEKESKALYQKKFKELSDMGYIACADKVNELVLHSDCVLKEIERKYLDLSAVGWDMLYIAQCQDCIHDEYEEKTKEHIKIELC